MQGTRAMSGTLYAMDVFMLDTDFLPGAHETFAGSLFANEGDAEVDGGPVAGAGRDP